MSEDEHTAKGTARSRWERGFEKFSEIKKNLLGKWPKGKVGMDGRWG